MSGRISAWHAPEEVWYPVAVDGRTQVPAHAPVLVSLDGGGTVVVAEIRRHPVRRAMWWWVQLGVWAGEGYGWARTEAVRLEKVWHEPVSRFSPTAFRPLDVAAWRHPLPAPLDPVFGANRPISPLSEPAESIDPHLASDGWPYPDIALGLGVPRSSEECEARVLRAFRTSHAQSRVGHGSGSTCADIPREMVLVALKLAEQERLAQERERGIVQSLEAVRSGWTPTKRDLADWWVALGWLEGLAPRKVRIVGLRAADPPWSYHQIKDHVRVACGKTAKAWYGQAMAWAFAAATESGQQAGGPDAA